MCAGVLLGPSFFGFVAPNMQASIFDDEVKSMIYVLSSIGLTIYMFLVGMDTDHKLITGSSVRQSASLSLAGILPTFFLGAVLALALHPTLSLRSVSPAEFAIFMGCALAMTAFPMLARMLQEMGLTKTKIGVLTLVAAAVDDAIAWALLAVIVALAQAQSAITGVYAVGGGALFTAFMLLAVRRLMKPIGASTEAHGKLSQSSLAIVLVVVLAAGWVTDSLGIFSVFGGFVAGLSMPQFPVFQRQVKERLLDFNVVFLLPLFFTYSGLNTRMTGITSAALLIPLILIIAVSFAGKYGGCTLAVRALGFSWGEASAMGGLMNARGLMELIIINVGLAYGIISQDLFSILAIMAVVTTAMAAPIFRRSLSEKELLYLKQFDR